MKIRGAKPSLHCRRDIDGQKYGPFYGQKYGPFYGQKYGPFYGQKYGPFYDRFLARDEAQHQPRLQVEAA
jgi:hypothetical protein